MAKKIKLDFSKVEERSGWNTRQMPEGLHRMEVAGVEQTEAQDGTSMLVYALVPTDSRFKSRRFPFYCKLQQNQLWKLRDLFVAAGETIPKKAVSIDPGKVVGKQIAAELEDDSYQGNVRSAVNGTYGLDILDDEAGSGPSFDGDEDESEDEYEDEADEGVEDDADEADEEEYEDEEGEDEEEEDDLDSMTLPELRALAKTLGIKTVKKTKDQLVEEILEEQGEAEEDDEDDLDDLDEDDLDEDDLGDEDLGDDFDDDLEDEEEEPEPAPKKRPAARKPAAKVAAPARRVVKRR